MPTQGNHRPQVGEKSSNVKEHLEPSPEKRTGKRPPKIGKVLILDVPETLDKRSCLE